MAKAQIFSLDALIGVGAFIIILVSMGWAWTVTKDRYAAQETRNDMELVAGNALASLLETPGRPPTWNLQPNRTGFPAPPASDDSYCIPTGDYNCAAYGERNISSLGLTKSMSNVLDEEKIKKLRELNQTNYTLIKQYLGIQGPGYEWYITFYPFNGTAFINKNNITIGNLYNKNAENRVIKQRMALVISGDVTIYNNSWALVVMEVWR